MSTENFERLVKFIAAVAGQEDRYNQELGLIHFIKYLFLADLAFARKHNGETFTGIPWIFHHFGPYDVAASRMIEPVLESIPATLRTFESPKFEGDGRRWKWVGAHADQALEHLQNELPIEVALETKRLVHDFGADTASLLDHVYRTEPMLRAAPGERLRFDELTVARVRPVEAEEVTKLTSKQAKQRKAWASALRQKVKASLVRDIEARKAACGGASPRYDDVFLEGVALLNSDFESELTDSDGELVVDDSVWRSDLRGRTDVH